MNKYIYTLYIHTYTVYDIVYKLWEKRFCNAINSCLQIHLSRPGCFLCMSGVDSWKHKTCIDNSDVHTLSYNKALHAVHAGHATETIHVVVVPWSLVNIVLAVKKKGKKW